MFIILEIQTFVDGTVSVLPPIIKANRNEAESAYHSILASAALSDLPMHAAVILGQDGHEIGHQEYVHAATNIIEEEKINERT